VPVRLAPVGSGGEGGHREDYLAQRRGAAKPQPRERRIDVRACRRNWSGNPLGWVYIIDIRLCEC
jgi:hypothetical protein